MEEERQERQELPCSVLELEEFSLSKSQRILLLTIDTITTENTRRETLELLNGLIQIRERALRVFGIKSKRTRESKRGGMLVYLKLY
jgi:hypothetical protein